MYMAWWHSVRHWTGYQQGHDQQWTATDRFLTIITSSRRAGGPAATICPRPGMQRKHTAAALSQAGPDQPIRTIQPVSRTHAARMYATDVRCQTDRRQTASSLNAPVGRGIIMAKSTAVQRLSRFLNMLCANDTDTVYSFTTYEHPLCPSKWRGETQNHPL